MSFLSTSTALTVYKISNHAAVTPAKLQQFAFQNIDDIPEQRAFGWTNIDDIFDTQWSVSVPEKGPFICFALRIDSRKVPAAVIKKHMDEALKSELDKVRSEGGEFISKARKKELKELHMSRLLSRVEPVPASVDVALDTSTGLLYVGTTSSGILETFEDLMASSFQVELTRLVLGGLEGKHDLDGQSVEQFLKSIYEQPLQIEYNDKPYVATSAGHATLCQDGGCEVTVKNAPDTVPDAGLEAGMSIRKLKITLSSDELAWELTLGQDFAFSGLKTPHVEKPKDDGEPDAALLEKLYLLEQAVGAMHTLFGRQFSA